MTASTASPPAANALTIPFCATDPDVRMLCNSDLDLQDLAVAKAVRDAALTERWNETPVDWTPALCVVLAHRCA